MGALMFARVGSFPFCTRDTIFRATKNPPLSKYPFPPGSLISHICKKKNTNIISIFHKNLNGGPNNTIKLFLYNAMYQHHQLNVYFNTKYIPVLHCIANYSSGINLQFQMLNISIHHLKTQTDLHEKIIHLNIPY